MTCTNGNTLCNQRDLCTACRAQRKARKLPFLARLLEAMRAHGEQSEPDMEVGDLQTLVRDLWSRLPKQQQVAVANDGHWRDLIDMWLGGGSDV